MQPEDIDQLFRDRLEGHAPTPPAYLWNQLEAEIQPKRKRPVMWLAAAAVALLTLLGGAWWLLVQQGPASGLGNGTVASVTKKSPEKKSTLAQATPTSPSPSTVSEAPDNAMSAQEVATSETSAARSAGVQPDLASEERPAALARTSAPRSTPSHSLKTTPPTKPARQALAANSPTTVAPEQPVVRATQPEPTGPANTLALTSSKNTVPMGPIEVEVRPATATAAVATTDASDYSRRPRLGALLQQARNAVRGDKVSLTDASLPEMVTVQARLGNRTLTKVIQL